MILTRGTGKYMKLLTILAMLSTPGSGSIFDEATIRVIVPVVLDDSLTNGGKDVSRG
jgi:hypothetical protein